MEALKTLDSEVMDQMIENDANDTDVEKGAEDAYEVRGEIICAKIRLQDVQLKNSIKENKEKVTIVSPSEREVVGKRSDQ